jgi:hypothetical protein
MFDFMGLTASVVDSSIYFVALTVVRGLDEYLFCGLDSSSWA